MVIGGQAVLLYGQVRATADIDITLGMGTDELGDLLNVLGAADFAVGVEQPHDFVAATMVLPVIDPASRIRIDLVFSFTPFERSAIKRARPHMVGNKTVMFTTVEDLLIHKIFAHRPRDLEDARHLVIKNPDMDHQYIERWLKLMSEGADVSYIQLYKSLI